MLLLLVAALGLTLLVVWWRQTKTYKSPFTTFWDQVEAAKPTGKRVCVIGSGLTGISAMKACLGAGVDFKCFEADSDAGGFWRYKPDSKFPSVYKAVHIDSDRDMTSFGDCPISPAEPVFLSNERVLDYLRKNIRECGLAAKIQFNTRVTAVTPLPLLPNQKMCRWLVEYTKEGGEAASEEFDGVMISVGRHGGGAYTPKLPGLESFTGKVMHSSQFKSADQPEVKGKKLVVVGIGNSGLDIVTECARQAASTVLVSRSGAHITKMEHGEVAFAAAVLDKLSITFYERWPWWWRSAVQERVGLNMRLEHANNQAILNKHGLKPAHRFWQQHILETGFRDPENSLHQLLEEGLITVRRGIERFTPKGVIFVGSREEIPADTIIFATGYRQAVPFLDQSVANLEFSRHDNDVFLYKYMFPMKKEHESLSVLCFLQSLSFLTAELQARLFVQVLLGQVSLPSQAEKEAEQTDVELAMRAQYIDRQQLKVQAGMHYGYYDDLAKCIGCYPSLWKLLKERPTAIWHAWFTTPQALHYRLVGEGRLEGTEKTIEGLYRTHYYGPLPDGRKRRLPNNRGSLAGYLNALFIYSSILGGLLVAGLLGYDTGPYLATKKKQNLRYASQDPVQHSLKLGRDSADVEALGSKGQVWGTNPT